MTALIRVTQFQGLESAFAVRPPSDLEVRMIREKGVGKLHVVNLSPDRQYLYNVYVHLSLDNSKLPSYVLYWLTNMNHLRQDRNWSPGLGMKLVLTLPARWRL